MTSVTTQEPIRVVLIDDHAIVRAGLQLLISTTPRIRVVGEAGSRSEVLALVPLLQCDVFVLDLDMGPESGLDLIPELLALHKDARILILTGVRDGELPRKALALGATGVVMKEQASEILLKAIERVHAGELWLDRTMTATLVNDLRQAPASAQTGPVADAINSLTAREREVITLIGEGLRNREIGNRLFLSETTVRHHLTSIFSKLGVGDRLELVIFAFRHGIITPPRK